MNKFKELKGLLTNQEVVQKYLGVPEKNTSSGLWYHSPFRREKTASFYVSNKGIHDFGSSEHFDIISFVQRYFHTTPLQALDIICRDFGLSIGNEYENDEVINQLRQKRKEENKAKELVKEWVNLELIATCNKIQTNKKCIEICKCVPNKEVLRILYVEQIKLEYYFEILVNANEQEKINLYLEAKNDKRRKSRNIRGNCS